MRYVVRNNFFGLESRPAIRAAEHEGRQKEPSEEVRAVSQSASLVSGERGSAQSGAAVSDDADQEDSETSKAAVVDQYLPQNLQDRGLLTDQVCSEQSVNPPVDSAVNDEQVTEDFIQNTEERTASDCHSLDLKLTDRITPASVYDDEIW